MASSYSTDLKLELMVTGENAGTWGDNTNNNLNLIQQAIAGYEAVALSDGGTVALVMTDKAISNARNMVLKFTGTLTTASTVTIPDGIEKFYVIDLSAVTGVTNLTIKTVSGTGFTAGEAAIVAAYSDGTNLNEIALNTLGGTIAQAQIDDAAISTAKLSDNAVTTAKISNLNVTEAKLAASAVTADKIAQSTITQAKLATDSVGSDQLISTGITAGAYTTVDITVDADGRITSIASGSAGGALDIMIAAQDSGSGNYTVNPAANNATIYACGGGAGGGTGGDNSGRNGGQGGDGGFGAFFTPATGGTPYPFSVGSGGAGGSPGPNSNRVGKPGNATTLPGLSVTANGGNGGSWGYFMVGSQGNPGSTPGATNSISGSGPFYTNGGIGGNGGNFPQNSGNPGNPGFLVAYDNSGA